ncbi:MAG: toprim domain-containing protein [Bacteroidales bacterium]|nr:toprim domain-containing protein [Bacteroidales bacterium]
MVKSEDLYAATNGGADLFRYYFPDFDPGKSSNLVRLRDDDAHPSASVFQKEGKWLIKDHGGSDNKARNMVTFVMEREHLEFKDALDFICKVCNIANVSDEPGKTQTGASLKKTKAVKERLIIRRKSGKFTNAELSVLGPVDKDGQPCITQKICDEFNLIPLDGYINPEKGNDGFSWMVEATDTYPIMMYDYEDWGKIYQPFGEVRFMYYGKKPDHYLFGCKEFNQVWKKALKGEYPHTPEKSDKKKKSDDYVDDSADDERWEALTICSGPSDALNVYKAGHIVCWPNSESEPLSSDTLRKLLRLTRNLYVLYDADATGIRNANAIALRNLEIQVISLPEDLGETPTGKRDKDGNPKMCKDIKDFCMYYKRGRIDPYKEFRFKLAKLAKSLKFWITDEDDGKIEISNAHLYRFLSANGFYKMKDDIQDEWKFVYEKDRVVEVIPDSNIVARVKDFLIQFIKDNPEHYSIKLENTIHRSKQINAESFKNLDTIEPDFNSYTADSEYFFFRNTIVKVTADGIEQVKPDKCPYYVLKHKVKEHDLRLCQDLFDVRFTSDYQYGMDLLSNTPPDTPDFASIKKELDKMTRENKAYEAELKTDFDYLRFVWNTGNKYWRDEENSIITGTEFPAEKRRDIQRNFINKVTTLGYVLCKFKSPSMAKAIYGMETSLLEEDEGSHNGGTGKSLLFKALNLMRKVEPIDGQAMKMDKWEFVFQRVKFDSDIVNIDDLNSAVDMNKFLSVITGNLQVNRKNKDEFVIPYERSPKFVFTSNHAIKRFSGSLQRRIQFVSFSDYYHSENAEQNMKERSPRTEFGRNLINDYNEKDMNTFYNFMLQCVRAYMRFGLIEPDMPDIEVRQKRAAVGEVFLNWADIWLENRLNQEVDRFEAFNAINEYCNKLKVRNPITLTNFKKKIKLWCDIRGYKFNPEFWFNNLSPSDQIRGWHRAVDEITKEPHEYFYIYAKQDSDSSGGLPY